MKKVCTLLIKAFPYYFVILILLTLLAGYILFQVNMKFTFQKALEASSILSIGTCLYAIILIGSIFLTKEKVYE